ncbi:MAG: sulfate transporter/antisigma-factor antagonist [Caulobacter sp.]|nr:sulfate transporter/antisigma-factor antagonist [Caulobacter sp.]
MAASKPQTVVVELSGELTIRTVTDAHAQLRDALDAHPAVTARIDAGSAVDLSFVQLIESARRTASETGRVFALAAPATDGLLETLHRGGFAQTADQRAFWLHQSGDC